MRNGSTSRKANIFLSFSARQFNSPLTVLSNLARQNVRVSDRQMQFCKDVLYLDPKNQGIKALSLK